VERSFYGQRRVALERAPRDQVVEQHALGGHVLLEVSGREPLPLVASRSSRTSRVQCPVCAPPSTVLTLRVVAQPDLQHGSD
jgi:hypothetical protein